MRHGRLLLQVALVAICIGMAGFAASEVLAAKYVHETALAMRAAMPGTYFSAASGYFSVTHGLTDALAPAGFLLLAGGLALRAVPPVDRRRIGIAVAIVGSTFVLSFLAPLLGAYAPPLWWSAMLLASFGLACSMLVWDRVLPRAFAVGGATLLVLRQVAIYHADALFVRATGDATAWPVAESWGIGARLLGALAASALALGLAAWLWRLQRESAGSPNVA